MKDRGENIFHELRWDLNQKLIGIYTVTIRYSPAKNHQKQENPRKTKFKFP
jgi:hypothetical protein